MRLAAVLLVLAACATAPRADTAPPGVEARERTSRGSNVITEQEIVERAGESDLYTAIQMIRPHFLRTRGATSMQTASDPIRVYVNNVSVGGIEYLRNFRATDVREVRWLSPADATTLHGTGNTSGAIMVTMRRGR